MPGGSHRRIRFGGLAAANPPGITRRPHVESGITHVEQAV